jgi:uncharacterized protein YcbX
MSQPHKEKDAMASQAIAPAGTVKSIWRYPVKSISGEPLDEAIVTDGGLVGDRAFALIDQSTGKVASAKLPKKWGGLLELAAAFVEPPRAGAANPALRITRRGGADIISDDSDADGELSQIIGRPVRLTATRPTSISVERLDPLAADETIGDIGHLMMEGRFADYVPIHLLTTATLARLAEVSPDVPFDERRFRPNLVVDSGDQRGFIENRWVGQNLAIGDDVLLRISDPTPRCSVPTLAQKGVSKDARVLRAIVEHNRIPVALLDGENLPCAGVYAFVIRGGAIRKGDKLRLLPL